MQTTFPWFCPESPSIYVLRVHSRIYFERVYAFVYVRVHLTLVHMCAHLFTLYLSNFDQARRMGVADNLLGAADGFVASLDYANLKDTVEKVTSIDCSDIHKLQENEINLTKPEKNCFQTMYFQEITVISWRFKYRDWIPRRKKSRI